MYILMGKRVLVALLSLSSRCLVMVVWIVRLDQGKIEHPTNIWDSVLKTFQCIKETKTLQTDKQLKNTFNSPNKVCGGIIMNEILLTWSLHLN